VKLAGPPKGFARVVPNGRSEIVFYTIFGDGISESGRATLTVGKDGAVTLHRKKRGFREVSRKRRKGGGIDG